MLRETVAKKLLLASAAVFCLTPLPIEAKKITEPKTGIAFPAQRQWGPHRLTAVGVAMKTKLMFQVYAACLYIDREKGREELLRLARARGIGKKEGRIDRRSLPPDKELYHWLMGSDVAAIIDLTFARSFTFENFRENYRRKLALYLDDGPLIERFLALPAGDIRKYGHLTFNLMPGGKVVLQYMGKTFGPIVSRALKKAVLGTFLGDRDADDLVRAGLVKKMDRLLR